MVTIVKTEIANIASLRAAFTRLGQDVTLSTTPEDIATADYLVLPGVGAFGAGMESLRAGEIESVLKERLMSELPTLAICLGLHLLCSESEETPGESGLSLIPTSVVRFPSSVCTPQFGWNKVSPDEGCTLLREGYAYFSNSFHLPSAPDDMKIAWSTHGNRFVAALEKGNLLCCQFHPELSGRWGSELLARWLGVESSVTARGTGIGGGHSRC